ncbi:MAG: DUF3822 family protein [Flavobacteriales bacterium]|jgi:hypothetical protein|nr:DUF3822 family protein [Flavobacteriales bacterium]
MEKSEVHKELLLVIVSGYYFKIIRDTVSKQVISSASSSKLEDVIDGEDAYNRVLVRYLDRNFTLIPTALYVEHHKKTYLDYTLSKGEAGMKYRASSIPAEKMEVIWGVDENIATKVIQKYKGANFESLLSSFISKASAQKDRNKITSLFLGETAVFLVVINGVVQLVNQFEVKQVEDALYYHLLLLQYTGVEEHQLTVETGGVFADMNLFLDKLGAYFSNIQRVFSADTNTYHVERGILEIEKSLH